MENQLEFIVKKTGETEKEIINRLINAEYSRLISLENHEIIPSSEIDEIIGEYGG